MMFFSISGCRCCYFSGCIGKQVYRRTLFFILISTRLYWIQVFGCNKQHFFLANLNFLPLNSLLATLSCLYLAYIYYAPNISIDDDDANASTKQAEHCIRNRMLFRRNFAANRLRHIQFNSTSQSNPLPLLFKLTFAKILIVIIPEK